MFLRKGTRFVLPYAAVSVTALDESGAVIGPASFKVEDGRTHLVPSRGAFSYRVEKPASWREPSADTVADGYLKPQDFRLPPEPESDNTMTLPFVRMAGQALRGKPETELVPDGGDAVQPDMSVTVGGVTKPGIFMHPPYRHGPGYVFLRYRLNLPKDKKMAFVASVGKPDFKTAKGDGTLYQIAVQPVGADISARKVVASAQVKEKKWKELVADLSPWCGQSVWLYLVADVGPANSSDCDGSAWGGIRLQTLEQ